MHLNIYNCKKKKTVNANVLFAYDSVAQSCTPWTSNILNLQWCVDISASKISLLQVSSDVFKNIYVYAFLKFLLINNHIAVGILHGKPISRGHLTLTAKCLNKCIYFSSVRKNPDQGRNKPVLGTMGRTHWRGHQSISGHHAHSDTPRGNLA